MERAVKEREVMIVTFPVKMASKAKPVEKIQKYWHSESWSDADFYPSDTKRTCCQRALLLWSVYKSVTQTNSEFISITRSVTSLQRTEPHNDHMAREKRNKTHHVLKFTPITLELWLSEHMKGKWFWLTFLYATQHARDKPNKAGLGWVLNTCFYHISMALPFLSILDPFSWLPLLSEIMSGHP